MGDLDKRLYTSHHAPTDAVSEPDCVKLAYHGCCWPRAARLSLLRYCKHTPHPCTVLTAAHHTHTRPMDVLARIESPQSLSNTYSSLELRSFLSSLRALGFLSLLRTLGITSKDNLEKIRKVTAKRAFEAHDLLLRSYYAAKSSPSLRKRGVA